MWPTSRGTEKHPTHARLGTQLGTRGGRNHCVMDPPDGEDDVHYVDYHNRQKPDDVHAVFPLHVQAIDSDGRLVAKLISLDSVVTALVLAGLRVLGEETHGGGIALAIKEPGLSHATAVAQESNVSRTRRAAGESAGSISRVLNAGGARLGRQCR